MLLGLYLQESLDDAPSLSAVARSSAKASRRDRVRWNLSPRRSTKRPCAGRKGLIAADGPLVCRTGQHTGRSPNDKFIVREPSSEAAHRAGVVRTARCEPAQFDGCIADLLALARRHRAVRPGLLRRRRSALPPADPRHHRIRLAQSLRRNLFIVDPAAAAAARAAAHHHRRAEPSRPIRRGTAPTPKWSSR